MNEHNARGRFLASILHARPSLLLAATLLAGVILRLVAYGGESLSGDELFSLDIASLGPMEGLELIKQDVVHPPLYYLLLSAWTHVAGENPTSLQALSMIFSALTIALVFEVAHKVTGNSWIGLLAATLTALSQNQAEYSSVVRAYAMYSALGLLVTLSLLWAKQRPDSNAVWIGCAITTTIFVMTHYMGWLFVAATFPAVLVVRKREFILRWMISVATAAGISVVWFIQVLPYLVEKHGLGQNLGWIGQPSFYDLAFVYARFVGLLAFPRGTTITLLFGALVLGPALIVIIKRVQVVFVNNSTQDTGDRLFGTLVVCCCALGPPLLLWLLAMPPISLPIWGGRQIIPSQPFLAIVLAISVSVIWSSKRVLGIGAAVLLVVFQAAWILQNCLTCPFRTPYETLAAFIQIRQSISQTPVLTTWMWGIGRPLRYYMGDTANIDSAPDDIHLYPDDFWFAYRPDSGAEQESFDKLIRDGRWRASEDKYFAAGWQDSGTWGVRLVLFEQPVVDEIHR